MKRKYIFYIVYIIVSLVCVFLFSEWRFRRFDFATSFDVDIQDHNDSTVSSIRIGTYNVKSLNEGTSLASFFTDVKDLELDIIALQELDQNAKRSGYMNMIETMANATNYPYYHFFESMNLGDGSYGLGILSKFPITEVESIELPNGVFSEPRILTRTTVLINKQMFHVFNTHVSYINREIREDQVEAISEHLNNIPNAFLLGDMNNFSESDIFHIEGMSSWNNQEIQYPTFRNTMFNDNVYVSENLVTQSIEVQLTSFSDHHMLWGIVNISEGDNQ